MLFIVFIILGVPLVPRVVAPVRQATALQSNH